MRTSVEVHAARVAAALAPLRERAVEVVPLAAASGRSLADAVRSPLDLPPFRNSQMDGVAVRAVDAVPGARLPIVGEVAAAPGEPAPLAPGTAVRIMTGAPVPAGADAVVPIEDVVVEAGHVTLGSATEPGRFVRERGSDLPAGAELLPAGRRLGFRQVAALAAAGLVEAAVRRRPRVAVLSTGSELAAPGATLRPGQIFDANGPALVAAVRDAGADAVLEGRVTDDAAAFAALLDAAVDAGAEVVLTSGGISRGEFEVVRETLEPRGALVDELAMQPGGPQALGAWRGVPVVCFPGNPVSSLVSFVVFVEPVLREVAALPARERVDRPLAVDIRSVPAKRQFLRGSLRADGSVAPLGGPSSHLVAALAAADVLLEIPEDAVDLAAGSLVRTWTL